MEAANNSTYLYMFTYITYVTLNINTITLMKLFDLG